MSVAAASSSMRRLRPAGQRSLRAFTLLELVVTVTVSAALFGALLAWVLNLVTVSAANLDTAAAARSVAVVTSALDQDFRSTLTCPVTGTPLHAATAETIAVFVQDPAGAPGQALLVTWRLVGSELTRSAVPATLSPTGCGPAGALVDPVQDPASTTWQTYATRAAVTPGAAGDALGAFTSQDPAGAGSVTFSLTVSSADTTSAPAGLTRTYELTPGYAGLS